MKQYCVIGNPINHSLSPYIFNHIFNINNIQASYDSYLASDDNSFINFINSNRKNIAGFNVTSPYKELAHKEKTDFDQIMAYPAIYPVENRNDHFSSDFGYNGVSVEEFTEYSNGINRTPFKWVMPGASYDMLMLFGFSGEKTFYDLLKNVNQS